MVLKGVILWLLTCILGTLFFSFLLYQNLTNTDVVNDNSISVVIFGIVALIASFIISLPLFIASTFLHRSNLGNLPKYVVANIALVGTVVLISLVSKQFLKVEFGFLGIILSYGVLGIISINFALSRKAKNAQDNQLIDNLEN